LDDTDWIGHSLILAPAAFSAVSSYAIL